ncbi:MAG TPA: glutamate ABC transporter substrate-binding protein [Marmoricola sp.]|jgi:glutamate transport system substrate-binding protein|nr:glutamate ABC transporter substrate-binding protein [Marmoricola sp.]
MRFKRSKALVAGAVLALSMGTLAACGSDSGDKTDVKVEKASGLTGEAKALADKGKITIGVKIDQPGIGYKKPGADAPEGFDIEIGRILAGALGIPDDKIKWVETVSDNREPFLQNGTVDLVIASYSITDERRKLVGQAGPYYVTGQQLLVREEDKDKITGPDDLKNVKVCSVEGSTSLARVQDEYGAKPVPFSTYSECVDQLKSGTVDAVTTDGAILLGYAAEDPDKLEVVGDPFSEERYGVGYKKGAAGMCEFITDTLKKAEDDGTWAEAFKNTLGKSGVETPEPPKMDPCPA